MRETKPEARVVPAGHGRKLGVVGDTIVVKLGGAQTGGARRLKVSEDTITAIRENHSRGIPPEDAQIVDFTRTLLRKHRVDDATAKAMRARLGDDQFIQLTTAIGYYSLLAMTVNACELEPAPGAEVLNV